MKQSTNAGSWIWRKNLKYRDKAQTFSKMEVGNGRLISFWFDDWSALGRLMDVAGERGVIDMGISKEATLAEAWTGRQPRRHRLDHLNEIEKEMLISLQNRTDVDDIAKWKGKNDAYTTSFSTKHTWNHIRALSPIVPWLRGVWFNHATPKYSFCTWLAVHDRLSTGERMVKCNRGASGVCVFCTNTMETRDHLFFSCTYVSIIWVEVAKKLWRSRFTTVWPQILAYISDNSLNQVDGFLIRYVFQATIYAVWRERNGRYHGESPTTQSQLI
ncbi:putative reverse transcriptase zinc-binding domain-containing protein [Arabidopsis thaliana]